MADIKVFTKDHCPYCKQLKSLLTQLNLDYSETSLEHDPNLQKKLSEENNGWRTVPMLFINKKFVGGFTDFKKIVDAGELQKWLG